MVRNFFSNWLVLAIISSIATAILIRASKEALGSMDGAIVMAVRIIGIGLFAIPLAWIALSNSAVQAQFISNLKTAWPIMAIVGLSGAVSWYTFYLALDKAGTAGFTDAAVTAVNYTSVAGVLLLLVMQKGYAPSLANWAGVVLVVFGAYLTSLRA